MSLISNLSKRNIATFIHLPNQFLISSDSLKYTWPKRYEDKVITMDFTVTQVEVVKRRNKRTRSCVSDSNPFDDMMINGNVEKNGCRAPYQKSPENLHLCASKEEMAGASLDPLLMSEEVRPCTSVRSIMYSYDEQDNDDTNSDWPEYLQIGLGLPIVFKEIIQKREVDIQTVIGNAGGYVGLFVGNS